MLNHFLANWGSISIKIHVYYVILARINIQLNIMQQGVSILIMLKLSQLKMV